MIFTELFSSSSRWLIMSNLGADLYQEKNMDDLQRFYDYFAKGKTDNGWLETPSLRLSLIGFAEAISRTVVERPEQELSFPLKRTQNVKFFLNCGNMKLQPSPPEFLESTSYKGHSRTGDIVGQDT
jgi:hypothetical protein